MTPRRRRFSRETRATLTRLLRNHHPAQTIAALQTVLDRFAEHEHYVRTLAALTRRARSWSHGLDQRLRDLQAYAQSLDPQEAEMFTGGPLSRQECGRLVEMIQPFVDAAAQETVHHVVKPGPPRHFSLNLELALALHDAGVPLKKSRQGLAHQVFVEVHATLGLTQKGGDVFHALEEGVTVAMQGIRLRQKKVL
jgi:hypothetical protein